MKRSALFFLLLANGVLLAAIAALWVAGDRGWHPPTAQRPEAASLAPETIAVRHAELASLPESLQRPLFSPTRSSVAEFAETTTPIGDFEPVLLGAFGAKGAGRGVIVRVEGKVYRIAVGQALGAWTLHAMDDQGGAIFKRADEQLKVHLRHLPQLPPPRAAVPVRGRAVPAPDSEATPPSQPAVPAVTRPAPSTESGRRPLAERIAERRRVQGTTTNNPGN